MAASVEDDATAAVAVLAAQVTGHGSFVRAEGKEIGVAVERQFSEQFSASVQAHRGRSAAALQRWSGWRLRRSQASNADG